MHTERANFPLRLMCRILEVSRAGYYGWLHHEPSRREQQDAVLSVKIRALFLDGRETYGAESIAKMLRKAGEAVSKARVRRLMKKMGLDPKPVIRRTWTTDSRHTYAVAPNLLERNFAAARPDEVWVGDITYIWTQEGWLYLSVLLDLFSRRAVGWCLADHLREDMALGALDMALGQRRPEPFQLIHHTDRGVQYAANRYQERLADWKITCSMSRKGDCWDNAVAESFFATLKKELVHRFTWTTRAEAAAAIEEYIVSFYNSRRRHSHVGGASPMAAEVAYWSGQKPAA